MLKAAARTVNAVGGQQCGTDNARGARPAVQLLFEDRPGMDRSFGQTGLPGAAACAPMLVVCGLYLFTLNPEGEPAKIVCGLYFYAERFKGSVEPARMMMLAAVKRRNQLALVQKPQPRLRPGWALVRVRLAGICNTDIEILRGYHNFLGTLGHEFVGDVVGVASAKDKDWIGRRVVGEINLACAGLGLRRGGRRELCSYCRRGIPTHCARRRVLGILGHDGAFAEFLALPVVNLYRVPAGIPDDAAVFTEPLAAACEILEQVNIHEHREACVLGDGKLAQLIARVLRTSGLRVLMIGKHADKLRLARRAGIETAQSGSRASRRANAFTLTIEATGSPSGLAMAQQITAPRGTLVLKSTFHGAAPVETWPIVVKELTVIGSRCGPFPPALALLRSGRVDPRPLISRVFRLKDAAEAIRYAQRPGVMKVLLRSQTTGSKP
jgi:alcohol dehydrogenase